MAKAKKSKSKGAKKTPWIRRIVIVFALLLGIGLASFGVLYAAIGIPDPNADWKTEVTTVYYADGENVVPSYS